MTEQNLTRNESADKQKYIWSTIVEESPDSTNAIRDVGPIAYVVQGLDVAGVHEDHLEWLWPRLSDKPVELEDGRVIVPLDEIDKFAATMRAAGPDAAVPWRDESEEGEPVPGDAVTA